MTEYIAIFGLAFGLVVLGLAVDRFRTPVAQWLNKHWRPAPDPLLALPLHAQALFTSYCDDTSRALSLANKVLETLNQTAITSDAPWLELNSLVNV